MNWFVYAIQSVQYNYIYVGLTSNVEKRISQHNSGKERTTKPYRPFVLVHREIFKTRLEARKKRSIFKVRLRKGIYQKSSQRVKGRENYRDISNKLPGWRNWQTR